MNIGLLLPLFQKYSVPYPSQTQSVESQNVQVFQVYSVSVDYSNNFLR